MSQIQAALTKFILNPANHDVLSIVKGARNGIVYGAKIRFPHALVMVFLFGSGSPREKFRKILTATRQHAVRLGSYVAIYKTVLAILRDLSPSGKQDPNHSFIAGLIGGWYMFGERTPINEQVRTAPTHPDCPVLCGTLHCVASAACQGALRLPRKQGDPDRQQSPPDFRGDHLGYGDVALCQPPPASQRWPGEQHGLYVALSDPDLYVLSDKWDGLRNFLWHNV